jgi:hypothetical protein
MSRAYVQARNLDLRSGTRKSPDLPPCFPVGRRGPRLIWTLRRGPIPPGHGLSFGAPSLPRLRMGHESFPLDYSQSHRSFAE